MAKDYGSGVSGVIDPEDISSLLVVFQRNKPPTDAELNLMGSMNTEERQKIIRAQMPSGWIGNPNRSKEDFHFHDVYTNFFFMGRQLEQDTVDTSVETDDVRNISYANVNGWVIPVTGTQVNNLTTLDDDDFRNKIILPFGPTTGFELNFVFLEVWQALLSPTPSTDNKPTGATLYKWGNVEFGGTNPSDDLIRPDIQAETTKRIQLQYRIRMVDSIDAINHPTGFTDTANVHARANLSLGDALTLAGTLDTTFQPQTSDEGLWRAGDGDAGNGLGTVDGYTYAIPICIVSRRNRGGYALSTVNGGVSRRSPPTEYVEGDPDNGSPLTPGELATVPASDRPDSLYVDRIVKGDVTDMRKHVSSVGHDHAEILEENLYGLFSNRYSVSPKMNTVGGTQYTRTMLYTDEVTAGADNPSTITIGIPDGVRRVFSDVPTPQAKNLAVIGATSKSASSPSFGTDPDKWMPADIIEIPHPNSLNSADYPSVFLTNNFEVTYRNGTQPIVAAFVSSATASTLTATGEFSDFSGDADQFQGYGVQITAGLGVGIIKTISTITNSNTITIFGTWGTTPDSTSAFIIVPLIIVATATSSASSMLVTLVSINGDTDFTSSDLQSANLQDDMWIEFTLHYPAAQGLSLRPDEVHQVNYTNPTSTVLVAPTTSPSVNLLVPRYIQHSPDFINPTLRNSTYFGTRPVQSDCYVDEGSKTLVVQPWQLVTSAVQARKHPVFTPSHSYFSLFDTRFSVEVPRPLLPSLGASAIPILETGTGVFFTGLHVWAYNETDSASEVIINLMGRSGFATDNFVGTKVFARQDSIAYEAELGGSPARLGCRVNTVAGGIEFPQYIGLARVLGVFEKSDFDINGITGTNILNFHATNTDVTENVWINRTTSDHTDVTFTLLPGAIVGYSDSTEYIIVANTFGFREGFIHENAQVAAHEQVNGVDDTVTLHLVVPQALPAGAVVQATYSRTPYQGSIYNRLEPFADTTPEPFNNRGLVSPSDLTDLDTPLDDAPTQGSVFHYEVLATKEFVTTLGTARYSGIGNGRFYGEVNISDGFPADAPRFEELPLSDTHLINSGFITRLPLGARYRDADFAGEDIITGQDRGPHINYSGEINPTGQIYSERTVSEPLAAGQVLTITEGNIGATSDTSRYRTTRGGSGYYQTEGGPLSGGSKKVRMGFRTLHGVAALVRSYDETAPENFDLPFDSGTNPNVLKNRGGELMMIIMTGVDSPIYGVQSVYEEQTLNMATAPTGVGEGMVAIDRYRLIGHPLERQPKLIPYAELVPIDDSFQTRVTTPSIVSVFPDRAGELDTIVVRGTGLWILQSSAAARGAEIFARRQDVVSDVDLVNLTPFVTDSSDDSIVFQMPGTGTMPTGKYDILVRAGDGQLDIFHSALTVDASASNTNLTSSVQNFTTFENGSFPAIAAGLSTNATGSFRITNVDAIIAHQSGFFRGTGSSSDDFVRIDMTSGLVFASDQVSVRFSFKLLTVPLATGQTLDIVHKGLAGSTHSDVFGLTISAASSFFTFTLFDELTGSGDVVVPTITVLDSEWHTAELVINDSGTSASLFFDGVLVATQSLGTALIVNGSHSPSRLDITNGVTATTTATQVLVDRLVTQNFISGTLVT